MRTRLERELDMFKGYQKEFLVCLKSPINCSNGVHTSVYLKIMLQGILAYCRGQSVNCTSRLYLRFS